MSRRERAGWLAALVSLGVLLVAVMAPPFVDEPLRSIIRLVFSPVCHQIPERSPHFHGVAFAVCHRCFGTYLGLFLGAAAFLPLRRFGSSLSKRAGALILVGIGIPAADWLLGALGLWHNSPVSRVVTGAVFGAAAGVLLAQALTQPGERARQIEPAAATGG